MKAATPSQRVEKARRKAISTSGKSRHDVILPPLAVAALGRLVGRGYAGSVTAVIARALVDADAGADAGRQVSPE